MNCKVIELNDRAIKVGCEGEIMLRSPGFALADGPDLVLGELAEQQARLQPTSSYNRYWQELNLDLIPHISGFRHHADIAFAHLQYLAREADITDEVIIAVPGSFTREQVAILLGLTQHCPFQVSGVVDSALAASLYAARASRVLYADLQLHQIVLTSLHSDGTELHCGTTVQIPGVGSQHFMDTIMQLATGMFIQQCRFNPQDDAQSEQQLYNQLAQRLAQAQRDGNLVLELHAGDVAHTAKMPMASLIDSLDDHFARITKQLAALTKDGDTQLLVSTALMELPGWNVSVPTSVSSRVIEQTAVTRHCLECHDLICDAQLNCDKGISLVKSLPLPRSATGAAAVAAAENPTHVLHRNQALSAKHVRIRNGVPVNGTDGMDTLSIAAAVGLPGVLGEIAVRGDAVCFDSGRLPYLHNGIKASGERRLAIGDRLQFEGSNEVLTLIQVRNV